MSTLWFSPGTSKYNWHIKTNPSLTGWTLTIYCTTIAGSRLACRLPHCRFDDDDICSTVQAPLAAEGWPSGKRCLANRSITLSLCPPWQTADSWILFNSGAMSVKKPKQRACWELQLWNSKRWSRGVAAKQQASLKPAYLCQIVLNGKNWKLLFVSKGCDDLI